MIDCYFEDGNKAELRHVTVDVLVLKDDQILLVKRNQKLNEGGKWGLTGGYMNRDETLVEAGVREVYEESGWEIKNLVLLAVDSNPNQPNEDRQNIKFVYFAEAVKQTGEPDWESDEIRWFPLNALPPADQIAFDHLSRIEQYQSCSLEHLALPTIN